MGTHEGLSAGGVVADTYRVTRLLGRGGMGAVWAAEHLRLPGRQVAVKVLLSSSLASGEAFARFRREAEIASRLGHPHIVQVLDFHTLPSGEPYIILELLQGETLAQRLQRGPLELEEALAIARQVGSALQAAHRAGVVHRDLKPDNVFLCTPQEESAGPNVKVLDFGISKIRGSQTVATQDAVLMGTPQYMAPEQALGKNTSIDARTDVFALGAIVYEMLGGTPAFGGSSLAEVVYKVVHAQPQPLAQLRSGLPLNVLSAVDRALQKDPAHRPTDVSAFIAELTGRPLTVPAPSPHTGGLDATLASPAQPISLLPGTEPTLTPATPVPLPRVTSAMPTPAPRPPVPWATPSPASPASAWPAPFSGQPTPRAELVTAPEARPALAVPPKPRRHVARWVVGVFVVLAFISVLRRNSHKADVAAALRTAEALSKQGAVPPVPGAEGDAESAAQAAAELKKGFEEVKNSLREALNAESDGQDAAKAAAEAARKAKEALAQKVPAADAPAKGAPPQVQTLLSDAEQALDDEDPKEALRLADQSFFIQKTSDGWAIKTRAHCQLKDLGNAKAAFSNVTGKAIRGRVVADCKEQGVSLR
jgi:eukaryotic-like serine/threonine-protein kinase